MCGRRLAALQPADASDNRCVAARQTFWMAPQHRGKPLCHIWTALRRLHQASLQCQSRSKDHASARPHGVCGSCQSRKVCWTSMLSITGCKLLLTHPVAVLSSKCWVPHLRDRREDGVLHLLGNAIHDPTETRPQQRPHSCCGCCLAGAAHQSIHCMLEVDRGHQPCIAAAPWLRSSN